MQRSTTRLMWIVTAGWVLATISFAWTGEWLLAMGFTAHAATGALIATGVADRTPALGWLTIALLVVATVLVASSAFTS